MLPEWPPELFKDSNDSNVGGRKRHRELCSPDVINRRSSVVRPLVSYNISFCRKKRIMSGTPCRKMVAFLSMGSRRQGGNVPLRQSGTNFFPPQSVKG